MKSLLYGLAAVSLGKTGLAIKDSNGNYNLEPINDPSLLSVRDPERTTTILEPILPSEMGLQRRDGHSPVGLQNETSMFWGQGSNGSNVMVNLTLATGETQMILSMDHFKEELASVICDDDLTLTFKDEATYQDAIDDWEWVNFEEKRTFIMIVNYGGCSSESGRQPWVVSAATYDNANFRVEFTADQTEWSDLNNPYEIEWGTYTPPSHSALAARWNPFDALDDLTSANWSPSFDVNLAHTIPATLWETTTTSGLDLTIGCDACGTTGKITVAGKLKGSLLKMSIDEAYVQAIPSNIGADFNPSFAVAGNLVQEWKKSWEIVKVPLSQFSIPLVFTVGPELRLSAGFELSGVQGSATVKTGISARIPDSATAKVDFHGSDTNVNGWKPVITTKPITFEAQVQGILAIYTAIGVDIGMTVFKKIDMGVGLELQVPKVTMKLGAEFNKYSAGAVCPNRPEMFGVKFDASIGVDLKIQGWNGDKDRPFFEKDLWNAPDLYKFPPACIPFEFGPKSSISLTKLVSGPTSANAPSTTSGQPASTKESVTTEAPSKPTSTEEPITSEPSKTTTHVKPTSEEPSKPTTLNPSTTEITTTEPAADQTAITAVNPTTTEGSSTRPANPTSIEATTIGKYPIGTGPVDTLPSGTEHSSTAYPLASGPIYSNPTDIWISRPSRPTTTPIIDYFPEPTEDPYNPGNPDGYPPNPREGSPVTSTVITDDPRYSAPPSYSRPGSRRPVINPPSNNNPSYDNPGYNSPEQQPPHFSRPHTQPNPIATSPPYLSIIPDPGEPPVVNPPLNDNPRYNSPGQQGYYSSRPYTPPNPITSSPTYPTIIADPGEPPVVNPPLNDNPRYNSPEQQGHYSSRPYTPPNPITSSPTYPTIIADPGEPPVVNPPLNDNPRYNSPEQQGHYSSRPYTPPNPITSSSTYPTIIPGTGDPPGQYNSTITTSTFTSSYSISTLAIPPTTPPIPTTSLPAYGNWYGYENKEHENQIMGIYKPRGRLARHLV